MSIDIAIIDSGINPTHPHVQGVAGGVSFDFNGKGRIIEKECFEDRIGHGTAIAGIFREALPTARIWALKVFQDDLTASSRLLLASLDWAVRADMKIIHLSLGTEREADHWPIEKLCQKAHQKGQLITAAARGCNDTVYPARLDTVIGTYWDKRCKPAPSCITLTIPLNSVHGAILGRSPDWISGRISAAAVLRRPIYPPGLPKYWYQTQMRIGPS